MIRARRNLRWRRWLETPLQLCGTGTAFLAAFKDGDQRIATRQASRKRTRLANKSKYEQATMNDEELLEVALEEARKGLRDGGLPIGAVLANRQGQVVARGHNLRVQSGDPTAHAETVCLRNAGRRRDWTELTLVSTLSPCIMCAGAALLFRIPRVVIGENRNFLGAEDLIRQHGASVVVLDDEECIRMMGEFISAHADLWNEDIGK
jgi:creatinine deaminase